MFSQGFADVIYAAKNSWNCDQYEPLN